MQMAKIYQHPILAGPPGVDMLERFVELLNLDDYWFATLIEDRKKIGGDYRPVRQELRRLVRAWYNSGPNVCKLLDAVPRLNQFAEDFRPYFIPTTGRTAHLAYLDVPEYSAHSKPIDLAFGLFLKFLINPFNEKLGGPCKDCHKFYVKKTRRQNVYCSKRCGLKHTSMAAIRNQRAKKHSAKLEEAKRLSTMWVKTGTSKGWKEWSADRSVGSKYPLTKHWLTRAAKNEELLEPTKQN
jgi:hypothetical protein